ncbi:MAG: helix-turn-helix domain-containing protein [Chloroflexi bacterium]|nr:helix-turn-helix domain-containing protein [Chloroflexota bacterium]
MPGPTPQYQPTIPAELTSPLEQITRKTTAPHQMVQRAKLALLLQADPHLDNPTLARRLGRHFNWVRYWRKRWATQGFTLEALQDRPGRGRKPRLSPPARDDGQGHRL